MITLLLLRTPNFQHAEQLRGVRDCGLNNPGSEDAAMLRAPKCSRLHCTNHLQCLDLANHVPCWPGAELTSQQHVGGEAPSYREFPEGGCSRVRVDISGPQLSRVPDDQASGRRRKTCRFHGWVVREMTAGAFPAVVPRLCGRAGFAHCLVVPDDLIPGGNRGGTFGPLARSKDSCSCERSWRKL